MCERFDPFLMLAEVIGGVAVDHIDRRWTVAFALFVRQVVAIRQLQIGVGQRLQQRYQLLVHVAQLRHRFRKRQLVLLLDNAIDLILVALHVHNFVHTQPFVARLALEKEHHGALPRRDVRDVIRDGPALFVPHMYLLRLGETIQRGVQGRPGVIDRLEELAFVVTRCSVMVSSPE